MILSANMNCLRLDFEFLFSVWFHSWSFFVFKKAGGCLSYNIYNDFTHVEASFTSYFLNMFILEKGRKKKGKFYYSICVFICYKVYIILTYEKLSCMSHSLRY